MDKKDLAISYHDRGYNCAQSVACAFSDEVGIDKTILMKGSEAFGLGSGDMQGMCGALVGALMLAGLVNSDGNLEAPRSKGRTYRLASQMKKDFQGKTGALICRDLKGIDTGRMICSCPDCIRLAVEVVQEDLGL